MATKAWKKDYSNVKITYAREDCVCHNCGKCIKNVAYVNGLPYGLECVKMFYPKSPKTPKQFAIALENQELQARIDLSHNLTRYVVSVLNIYNVSNSLIDENLSRALADNSPDYIVWLAYKTARAMLA